MSAGNPELVIHDGDVIMSFIDEILAGYNIQVDSDVNRWTLEVSSSMRDPDDGMPMIAGYRLDADDEPTDEHIAIAWQEITRIEVW